MPSIEKKAITGW